MPLLTSSDPSIVVSRNGGQYSSTEVQTITVSADKPFVYEVQSISLNSCSTFDVSFMGSSTTKFALTLPQVLCKAMPILGSFE
jgi:hypothetical protein